MEEKVNRYVEKMSDQDRSFCPVNNKNYENAMFSIVLDDKEVALHQAGCVVKGVIFIHFENTQEPVSFKQLNLYLKKNVSLPEVEGGKKNAITHIAFENSLLGGENVEQHASAIEDLNASKRVQVPFELELPVDLPSSFNSSQVTVCYELRAELLELQLCGEVCDLSSALPIEIVQLHNESKHDASICNDETSEYSSQIQEGIDGELVTFYASMKKDRYFAGEHALVDIYLDTHSDKDIDVQFEILQIVHMKHDGQRNRIIVSFKETFRPASSGILLTKQNILLQNTILNTQPSVNANPYVTVEYFICLATYVKDVPLQISIPVIIQRKESVRSMFPQVLSTDGIPLLPINVTANELKNDGLQSYIPMKQCYENKRLIVKKGNLSGPKALLTIISESYTAYTKHDTIKGFVYFSVHNSSIDVHFEKLLVLLVGVLRYKNEDSTNQKNGEMFLYERKVLQGTENNDTLVTIPKHSSTIVVEFEFDLSKINETLLPTFNSPDVIVSYELKADVFNLHLNGKKSSLYTTIPIVIKESKLCNKLEPVGSFGNVYTKDFFVSANIDKPIYQHKDDVIVNINLENKSRKQMTLCIQLNQVTESFHPKKKYSEVSMSKPIVLLVLPKSKLVSTEKISLGDNVFRFQPTLVSCSDFSVTYNISINSPSHPYHKLSIPVLIIRRSGYAVPELSREGYPLLPITLEFYSDECGGIPKFMECYNERSLVNVLKSKSSLNRWEGWKLRWKSN